MLRVLLSLFHEVTFVITRPPARRGRRKTIYPPSMAGVATEFGMEPLEITALKTPDITQCIEDVQADLDVTVAYGGLAPPSVLAMPVHGWTDLYSSDLPKWRGAAPVRWTIREGGATTASCMFNLEEGLDTGNVYSRVEVPIGHESAGELFSSMAEAGTGQVLGVIDALTAGSSIAAPQPSEGTTYARRLEHVNGYASFTHNAGYEDRVIRSTTPNPDAYTVLPGGAYMKFDKVTPVGRDDLTPRQLEMMKEQVTAGCMSGASALGKAAPIGKSQVDAAVWAREARPSEDLRLGRELEREQ